MMTTEVSGRLPNQSIGGRPSAVVNKANRPLTGCISMFFQISALTVGMTKNGAITSRRAMPRPKNSWSNRTASSVPSTTVIDQHRADQKQGVEHRGPEGRVGQQEL